MHVPMHVPRRAALLALVLATTLAVAACGSSSSSSSTTNASATSTTAGASSARAALTAYRSCLKQHGVTLPSFSGHRPNGGFAGGGTGTFTRPAGAPPAGGGFPGGGFAGGFGNSKFAKAAAACKSKLPKGARFGFGGGRFGAGGFGGGATGRGAFSTKTLDSYVACIRKNGYPQMPDPNTSGKGAVFSRSVETNAKFQAANRKCVSILTSAFRGGAAGAPTGGGPGAPSTTIGTTSNT